MMDNTLNHEEEMTYLHANAKLWDPKGFIFIGIFFSFLPAAILYSLNYGRLGLKKERTYNLLAFGALVILLSLVSFYMKNNITKAIFYGVNIALSSYMRSKQLGLFKEHIENGGKKASYLIPVIICLVFVGLLLWATIYSINVPENSLHVADDELFYTERVTAVEAEKIGNFLQRAGLFANDNVTINAGIDRRPKGYIFSLVVKDEAVGNKELAEYMKYISNTMSKEVLSNQPVEVNLCDGRFKVIKTIQ